MNRLPPDKQRLYSRVVASREYRALETRPEKAWFLHHEYSFTRRELLLCNETTECEWKHLKRAIKYHRRPGLKGRPRLLSPSSESCLVDEIKMQAMEQKNPTVHTLTDLVCLYVFNTNTSQTVSGFTVCFKHRPQNWRETLSIFYFWLRCGSSPS